MQIDRLRRGRASGDDVERLDDVLLHPWRSETPRLGAPNRIATASTSCRRSATHWRHCATVNTASFDRATPNNRSSRATTASCNAAKSASSDARVLRIRARSRRSKATRLHAWFRRGSCSSVVLPLSSLPRVLRVCGDVLSTSTPRSRAPKPSVVPHRDQLLRPLRGCSNTLGNVGWTNERHDHQRRNAGARRGGGAQARRQRVVDRARPRRPVGRPRRGARRRAHRGRHTDDLRARATSPIRRRRSAIVDACDDRFGAVHGVVNVAAATSRATLFTDTPEHFDTQMTVNVKAPYFLIQAAAG